MKTIKIAVKEPFKAWEIREVEDTLPTYQGIVGGNIEHFGNQFGADLFCNEEGMFHDLKFNVYYRNYPIFGTIFAVGADDEEEFVSLTAKQAKAFTDLKDRVLYFKEEK